MKFLPQLLSLLLLLLASISVALYYNITFFGKAVVALPSFPVAGGCLFYYLAAFNTTPPVAQVVLWMASFVISGWLWWWVVGRVWSHSRVGAGAALPPVRQVQLRAALLPYLLPLPWLLWVHAQSATGPSLDALRAAILVRDGLYWTSHGSELRLNLLFLLLAVVETLTTLAVLHRSGMASRARVMAVFLVAGLVSLTLLCGLAQLAFAFL